MIDPDAAISDLVTPIRVFLRRYCGDDPAVDDIAQETLLRIARSIATFDGRSSLKTWAFTIATRTASDHFRRLKPVDTMPAPDSVDELIDETPGIEQRLVIDEMNTCVRETIDALPDMYRAPLILRDLEGLTLAEVAGVCGCSLPTAKIRLHRARRKLQEKLDFKCEFYTGADDILRCDRKPG